MFNCSNSIAFLVLAALLLAGCLSPLSPSGDSKDPTPPLGMGLELPDTLPPPGPFREDPGHLKILENFLNVQGREILEDCGRPQAHERLVPYLEEEHHWSALGELTAGCREGTEHREIVDQAMKNGTEKETYNDLMLEALESIDTMEKAIDGHAGPGNTVEAQLLYRLMVSHIDGILTVTETVPEMWDATDQKSDLGLRNIYANLMSPVARGGVMMEILDRFPWSGGHCELPDIEVNEPRITEKIEYATQLAHGLDHHKERGDEPVNIHYIRFNNIIIPRFEYLVEQEWSLGLMGVDVAVDGRVAYWESFSDPVWPTMEEAEFILAETRNESRTIWNEANLASHLRYFESERHQHMFPWGEDIEETTPAFLSVVHLRWPFEGMECQE